MADDSLFLLDASMSAYMPDNGNKDFSFIAVSNLLQPLLTIPTAQTNKENQKQSATNGLDITFADTKPTK